MEIRKLTINNIRAYFGKHEIAFATSADQNVTLVHGVSGAGKTSLFIALNWVLFGSDFTYSGHLANNQILPKGDSVGGADASVGLEFAHKGTDYYLTRGLRVERGPNGSITERESGLTLYAFDSAGQSKLEQFADTFLKALIPNPIRTFFFFDGDKISDFAKAGRQRDVEITRAVNDVLQLDLVERSARHLSAIARDIERDIAKHGSPKVKEIETRRDVLEKLISDLNTDISQILVEEDAAEQRLTRIDEDLQQLSAVSEKAKRRELLEKDFSDAKRRISEKRLELIRGSMSFLPSSILPQLQKASVYLEGKRKKREIPGNYKEQFLRDLLSAKMCICERPLVAGSAEWEQIEARLGVILPGGAQEKALELSSALRRIISSQNGSVSSISALRRSLLDEQEAANTIENELRTVISAIGSVDTRDVVQLETERRNIRSDIRSKNVARAGMSADLLSREKEVLELKRQFASESAKEAKHANLLVQSEFASKAATAFELIRERLVADLRVDMGDEATSIFKTFTWKKEYFERVVVGDDYLLIMQGEGGEDLRAGMSMGETQLLSLAFILSMIAISDYEAPLVIDMPVARLSVEVRQNLLTALPRLSKQLVLLCTDTEMDASARNALGATVGAEYHLRFDEGQTTIGHGGLN